MNNLTTLTDPHSAVTEAFQSLRTSLEFSRLGKELTTLLVAAVDSTEEKSTAVANLAVVMAQAGDKVILVDGDLRRPQQHEIFGLSNQTGLSTWLQNGGAAPLQASGVEGLQVLVAGPNAGNPVALLSTRRLAERLTELRDGSVSYIIIDAPPVLAVTDAALWASQVDGVVLLINAGATKRDQAERARQVLTGVQAQILGAVLLNAETTAASGAYAK
jgi:capsular exopolysaccharide synthesis family protein